MARDILIALAVVVGVPALLGVWIALSERVLAPIGRKARSQARPWLWLLPGLAVMGVILLFPFFQTIRYSLGDKDGEGFVGLANFEWALTAPANVTAILNTFFWMLVLPILTLIVALVFAVLVDRVKYERFAKAMIMIPASFSFVVGAVMWNLVYRYTPPGAEPIGFANAVVVNVLGQDPVAWLLDPRVSTWALMIVGLWMWLGFSMILINAAVKGVPAEFLEAARIDGANEWQVFRFITFRQLVPILLVVLTTLTIWALKTFDIVYVMTSGMYNTQVLATQIYREFFTSLELGRGSAIALVLFAIAIPVMALNIWRIRREEKVGR